MMIKQRKTKKQGKLSAARIGRLEALGFVRDPLEATWEEMFAALVQYKKKNNDCDVPKEYPANPQLGTWVAKQRNTKKQGKLSAARIGRLEALGFVWDPLEAAWEEMFTALVEYKGKNNHCNVPQGHPENPQLAHWVNNQRQRKGLLSEGRIQRVVKNRGQLSEGRIRRLEALAFVWDPHEATWEEMFAALVEYKGKNNRCNVPRGHPENPQLGRWVAKQRHTKKQGTLSTARIGRLEALGFVWSFR